MTTSSSQLLPTEVPHLLTDDRASGTGIVRVLTLSRPSKRNALNTVLVRDLKDALRFADESDDIRAVVLAGDGTHFCAGGDLKEFQGEPDARALMIRRARLLADILVMLPRLSVPVITAVQGAALGAGAALAIGADMSVAGGNLSLGYPEIRDSVVPALVIAQPVHQLNRKLAFDMISTGRKLGAGEAQEHGLVNRVVAAGEVLDTAFAVAAEWAALDPDALRETKRLFYRVAELPHEAAIRTGLDATAATWNPRQ